MASIPNQTIQAMNPPQALPAREMVFFNASHWARCPLFRQAAARYDFPMIKGPPITRATAGWLALGTAAFAAVSGLAFALWMENSAAIFLSTVEAGLSWCF
ncbi:hypothetical protein [Oryzicola mucosus]|uniref:Uncharacterized protein n=1 Tax=Oryzicola mucosus TaxID=2767425 RepID=A0A8J6PG99_9HYPH|nr:hypothetical protein [Oryzicola mucosus]MBD0414739.1 hypothetical protein [Oryzicola mucosus]